MTVPISFYITRFQSRRIAPAGGCIASPSVTPAQIRCSARTIRVASGTTRRTAPCERTAAAGLLLRTCFLLKAAAKAGGYTLTRPPGLFNALSERDGADSAVKDVFSLSEGKPV